MSQAAAPVKVTSITPQDLERLRVQVTGSNLPEEDRTLIEKILQAYADLVDQIGDKNASIEALKRLLFGSPTESKENFLNQAGKGAGSPSDKGSGGKPKDADNGKDKDKAKGKGKDKNKEKKKKKKPGHGRIPAEAYTGAERVEIAHEHLKPGCKCPECSGTLYAQKPRVIVRICGAAPFHACVYARGCLRCSLCGKVFTAKVPPEVGDEKFDETVTSMAAILRYGKACP